MDEHLKNCLDSLNDNEPQVRDNAVQLLLRLCQNIVSFPDNGQYRRVRVSNSAILEKLLPASGAMESLFEMGFVEDGEYFLLPLEAPLSRLRQVQKALHCLQTESRATKLACDSQATERTNNSQTKKPSIESQTINLGQTSGVRPKIHQEKNFLHRIANQSLHSLKYEDTQLQIKARRVVPIERLQVGAMRRMRDLQREIKTSSSKGTVPSVTEDQITVDDFLLAELLEWFKNEFFVWVDSPTCSVCTKPCKYESVELSEDPKISRTEIHKCGDCGIEAKFPRYTDPGILLKTRRGRCGEWANAFTLICRSLGFDVRLVHDETDHVWTEIWSIASNRWIHADPCENAMDRPLIYERGWKKKLTYVIAYSRDEVQDVTWRYTRDQAAVMRRRKLCTEEDLRILIWRLNEQRQNSPSYSEGRKRFVTKRRVLELVELMPAPPGTKKPNEEADTEYGGRISGSLAWRSSRGETTEQSHEPHIWKIPRGARSFELRYFSAKDGYQTFRNGDEILEEKPGWENGVEAIEGGIFRKVETDWKMAYLARSVGQKVGKITWSFEVPKSEVAIAFIKIHANCATFEDATVQWKITGFFEDSEKKEIAISIEDIENFKTDELNGVSRISLSAVLAGGKNKEAWQHAQLFRQSLDNKEDFSMSIIIETHKKIS